MIKSGITKNSFGEFHTIGDPTVFIDAAIVVEGDERGGGEG
jgi:hypothetical protein